MGLKSLLFEEVETGDNELDLSQLSAGLDYSEPTLEVADVDTTDSENVVEEIYAANNIANLDKSIFKVEDLMKTLPSEMPTVAKRTTVESIMATVGLDVTSTIEDGRQRIDILSASLNKTVDTINSDITGAEERIEQLKLEIAENEKLIADSKATIKEFSDDVSAEVERISGLINFIDAK